MQALISVSDKTGIVELARELAALGVGLLSTGGTAKLLADAGLAVTEVAAHTGFPEMLDGRVKTLHPKIHGGLLARRELPAHMASLREHGIATIDILVVNLYPFEATVAAPAARSTTRSRTSTSAAGDGALGREELEATSRCSTDASQYPRARRAEGDGAVGDATQFALRGRRLQPHLELRRRDQRLPRRRCGDGDGTRSRVPGAGERPLRQAAGPALRREPAPARRVLPRPAPAPGSLVSAKQLQGKELSYNNIADADARGNASRASTMRPACVIVKHANPCGVALGATRPRRMRRRSRPIRPRRSAASSPSTRASTRAARLVAKQFVEVLIAPLHARGARRLRAQGQHPRAADRAAAGGGPLAARPQCAGRQAVGSGLLIQTADNREIALADLKS
jgi:phosphoribosylaminoimidazolecarboxamide formyltransferase/IMP cyclohydrolase